MLRLIGHLIVIACVCYAFEANATGLATCNSGPQSGWKSEDALRKVLVDRGWQIRRIKIDGGCYEVYAINEKGQRVESYFHPVTFDHVLTSTR
jgi:hypothetical protein